MSAEHRTKIRSLSQVKVTSPQVNHSSFGQKEMWKSSTTFSWSFYISHYILLHYTFYLYFWRNVIFSWTFQRKISANRLALVRRAGGVYNQVKVLVKVVFSDNNSDVFEWLILGTLLYISTAQSKNYYSVVYIVEIISPRIRLKFWLKFCFLTILFYFYVLSWSSPDWVHFPLNFIENKYFF